MTAPSPGTIVVHGPTGTPRFALSFDDGPSPCTSRLLDLLAARAIKATFFMVGSQLQREPQVGARVRDEGHEVALHSMAHLDHAEVGADAASADLLDGAEAIERTLGVRIDLFRAPFGHFVPATLALAEERGWTSVHWSAWGEDWREGEDAGSIAERVIAHLHPGAIVLLHDGRREKPMDCERMLAALELVLEEAGRRALAPVTVGELLSRPQPDQVT